MKIVRLCISSEIVLGSLDPALRTVLHKDDKNFWVSTSYGFRRGCLKLSVQCLYSVRNLWKLSCFPFSSWFCSLSLFLETGNSFSFWIHPWNKCFRYCYNWIFLDELGGRWWWPSVLSVFSVATNSGLCISLCPQYLAPF